MNWLAILLSLASLGGNPAPGEVKPRKHCTAAQVKAKQCKPCTKAKVKAKKCKAPKPKPKKPAPSTPAAPRPEEAPQAQPEPTATATPVATAAPEATATPAPPGTYPTRTSVALDEWYVSPSRYILAAGRIEFNVINRGEDDHDFSVRGGGREYGRIALPPRESSTLSLDLWLGKYTLYCSLPDHEAEGMRAEITVG